MEQLFSESELRKLYDDSQVTDTVSDGRAREEFVEQAQRVLAAFSRQGDAPLFDRSDTAFPDKLTFSPLFGYIRSSLSEGKWLRAFCPHAFAGWEEAFISSLSQLFGALSLSVLEEETGEMTFPSDVWCREKALPLIESGRHFRKLAAEYPLCARQLIGFTLLQAEHIREIAEAVTEELPGLYQRFFPGRELRRVTGVSASDSDRHNGGRSAHILTFEDGGRLVYKPHDMKMDRAFGRWIDLCAGKAGIDPFLLPVCADTKRGGFCSFIAHRPLESRQDAARYYYRVGFLLGAVWLMRGNDLHCENIIAQGAEPVLIDTETLAAPDTCLLGRLRPRRKDYSVTDMAVLPILLSFPGLNEAKYGGLCDAMPGSNNLPEYGGEKITGRAYAREISNGFIRSVSAVTDDPREAGRAFTEIFNGCRVRSVIRPTAAYMRLLSGLSHISCQGDLKRYKRMLDRIRLTSGSLSETDRDWINREESSALMRLDVPFFAEEMTEETLRELTGTWEGITEETVRTESERIFFGLTLTDPRAGIGEALPMNAGTQPPREKALSGLARQIPILEALLPGGDGIPAVVSAEQDDYLVCKPLRDNNGILEGSLGAIVALSACCEIPELDTRTLREKLRPLIRVLLDTDRVAPVLTGTELSLAAGGAGYVLGCRLCHLMGMMSDEEFRRALSLLAPLEEQEEKLRYSRFEVMYGSYDMIYALSLLPREYMTPALEAVRACLLRAMDLPEEEICRKVKEALKPAGSANPVKNNSLRFGNAGKLMACMERTEHTAAEREKIHALVCALAEAEHVLPGIDWPEGYIESGLFHGMPGVVYSLCRYLAPGSVPAL